MRTATNHEDNQLFKDAAHKRAVEDTRNRQINILIQESLAKLHRALAEDFGLDDHEIVERTQYGLEHMGSADPFEYL